MPACAMDVPYLLVPELATLTVRLIDASLSWLMFAGHSVETNAQTIPGVDSCRGQSQVDQFLAVEALTHLVVHAVRNVVLAD